MGQFCGAEFFCGVEFSITAVVVDVVAGPSHAAARDGGEGELEIAPFSHAVPLNITTSEPSLSGDEPRSWAPPLRDPCDVAVTITLCGGGGGGAGGNNEVACTPSPVRGGGGGGGGGRTTSCKEVEVVPAAS